MNRANQGDVVSDVVSDVISDKAVGPQGDAAAKHPYWIPPP